MPTLLNFNNRFIQSLPADTETRNFTRQVNGALWSAVTPTPVEEPRLLTFSEDMAAALGLAADKMHSPEMVAALGGNAVLPGSVPYATCYGGHQFGNWAGQLGDGRAIYLGEVTAPDGAHWELQLKGAGPTPYSRRADGRAVLRSSIREFLCSEAMHYLGVPTTRALSLVATGDDVLRDMFYNGNAKAEPGAVVCRVAPSFTRFGHFELPASRGDTALLKQLIDFTIAHDFADLALPEDPVDRLGMWFSEVAARTACMVTHWMRVGFVHGVMNTDNMSILGLTIDYGPYGWVDNFDPGWTPNTTDAEGKRYAFGRQPEIARWNLSRLGAALATMTGDTDDEKALVTALNRGLAGFDTTYNNEIMRHFSNKFGFATWQDNAVGDEVETDLINDAFNLLHQHEMDMTLFFRTLATVDCAVPDATLFADVFYGADNKTNLQHLQAWLTRYTTHIRAQPDDPARVARMNAANPIYVLRNYLAQQAIDLAEAGDNRMVTQLLQVLKQPYTSQAGMEAFAAKRPEWARNRAGCSMLSCSS